MHRAKNVPDDWLQITVPQWLTAIEFVPDSKKIITSTGLGKVSTVIIINSLNNILTRLLINTIYYFVLDTFIRSSDFTETTLFRDDIR